jgi:hypothetical protein
MRPFIWSLIALEGSAAFTARPRIERADLETVISDLTTGQFSNPVRVVAFNTLEHWAKDVSADIAEEIRTRCDIEGNDVPEHIRDFVENYTVRTKRLNLRLA